MGFGLYGSIHGPTDYQVNIQVQYILLKEACTETALAALGKGLVYIWVGANNRSGIFSCVLSPAVIITR